MGRRKGFGKIKKPKVANFELIDWQAKPRLEPYRLLEEVRKASPAERREIEIQADRDREVFKSIYGCFPWEPGYVELFK